MTVKKVIADLCEWLTHQRYNPFEGATKGDRNYRAGWNDAITHVRRRVESVDANLEQPDKPGG